jgi:hypothetical protein
MAWPTGTQARRAIGRAWRPSLCTLEPGGAARAAYSMGCCVCRDGSDRTRRAPRPHATLGPPKQGAFRKVHLFPPVPQSYGWSATETPIALVPRCPTEPQAAKGESDENQTRCCACNRHEFRARTRGGPCRLRRRASMAGGRWSIADDNYGAFRIV